MDKDEITAEAERIGTLPDLDHPGPGLLHAVHAAASGDAGAARPRSSAAERALPIDGDGAAAVARRRRGGLPIPGARITGSRDRARELHYRRTRSCVRVRERDDRRRQAGGHRVERSRERDRRAAPSTGELVDRLAWTAVFGATPSCKGTARWILRSAGGGGRHPARVDSRPLHGDGPRRGRAASRCRRSTSARWPTTRRARSSARRSSSNAGAFIFEIARSEIGYTEQRPHEYAAVVLGGGAARGLHAGRCSSRATTSRPTPRSTTARIATRNSTTLRALIKEEIAAGFYNIDIDTSTLVDLDKATLDEQQEVNVRPGGRLRGVHPRSTSRRASRCRSAARSARSAARTPTSTSCTPTWTASTRR